MTFAVHEETTKRWQAQLPRCIADVIGWRGEHCVLVCRRGCFFLRFWYPVQWPCPRSELKGLMAATIASNPLSQDIS